MDVSLNDTNKLLLGTGEFALSPGATSVADAAAKGFYDFGNITAFRLESSLEKKEHIGSYRGIRREDKSVGTLGKVEYLITCDEWDQQKLIYALMGVDAGEITQAAAVAANGDELAFGTTAAVIDRWYPLTISGARVYKITTLTIATLVEDTDFVVDKIAGRVRFLTAQAADLTPVISAPEIASGDDLLKIITPLDNFIVEGYGELNVFDEDHTDVPRIQHRNFSCDVSLDSGGDINGENFATVALRVKVTGTVGQVLSAE
jgi:hypothetical protein